jgi:excisionase family DNA binding protein
VPLKESQELKVLSKPEEGLVDIAEAARILAVSVSTLYGWVWQRKITFVKMGRAVRFEQSVLREFIEQNRVQPRRIAKIYDSTGRASCYNERAAGKG